MSTRRDLRDRIGTLFDGLRERGVSTKRVVLGTVALAVTVLTIGPLVFLLWTSVWSGYPGEFGAAFTVENFRRVYVDGFFDVPTLFVHSLIMAVGMTTTGLAFGVTFAWLFVRTNLPTKGAMELVLLSGQTVPGYVFAIMYVIAYSPSQGIFSVPVAQALGMSEFPVSIFSPWGIAFVAGVNVVSSAYLISVPAFQDVDMALEEVSRVHGADLRATVRSVTLPLIKPALLSATITIFLYGMGEFAVVSVLGARRGFDVYSTAISKALANRFPPAYGEAAALSVSLLVITGLLVWYYRQVTKRKQDFMTQTGTSSHNQHWDLGQWRWPLAGGLWTVICFVWVLPIVALFLVSLHGTWTGHVRLAALTVDSYATAVADPTLREAFVNSLLVAGGAATLGTVLSVGVAYYTERTTARFRGPVDFLSLTPLAVPGIIAGAALIFMSLWVGKLPVVTLYGTLLIIVIGSVFVYLPISTRIAVGNIVQIHSDLEEAARNFGASWVRQMREIFLPLFKNTAIVLWFFIAVHVFQLLSISWMTYTSDTVVIPVKLYQLYTSQPSMPLVAAISAVFIGLTLLAVLGLRLFGITFYALGQGR